MATNKTDTRPIERPAYRPAEWKVEARVGATKMWQLIRDGELKVKRAGRCTFILTSPRQWLESLPEQPRHADKFGEVPASD